MGRCRVAGQRCCQGLAVKCLSRHEIWYALCSHSDFIHCLNFILGGRGGGLDHWLDSVPGHVFLCLGRCSVPHHNTWTNPSHIMFELAVCAVRFSDKFIQILFQLRAEQLERQHEYNQAARQI